MAWHERPQDRLSKPIERLYSESVRIRCAHLDYERRPRPEDGDAEYHWRCPDIIDDASLATEPWQVVYCAEHRPLHAPGDLEPWPVERLVEKTVDQMTPPQGSIDGDLEAKKRAQLRKALEAGLIERYPGEEG